MELQSYQSSYLITVCPGEEAGRGGGGRYDTLPGLKPRHSAPVTNERGMKKKHSGGGGSTSCVCAAGLRISCTVSSFLPLSLFHFTRVFVSVWFVADTVSACLHASYMDAHSY